MVTCICFVDHEMPEADGLVMPCVYNYSTTGDGKSKQDLASPMDQYNVDDRYDTVPARQGDSNTPLRLATSDPDFALPTYTRRPPLLSISPHLPHTHLPSPLCP